MTPDLFQKTLRDLEKQLSPRPGCHVAEHMRRIKTLLPDIQIHFFHQTLRDQTHRILHEILFPQPLQMAIERPFAQLHSVLFNVQRILNSQIDHVIHPRLRQRPPEIIHDQEQAAHRIQLLGRTPGVFVEFLLHEFYRQLLQYHPAEYALPAPVQFFQRSFAQ